MTEQEMKAIEERWARDKRQFGAINTDFDALLAEVRRLNELLEMRCTNCHLKKESEVADNG